MIFVETSAFVECLLDQPESGRLIARMLKSKSSITGAHVRLETCMVLANRLVLTAADANDRFEKMLDFANIKVEPLTDEISMIAVHAFGKFGKGQGHKAQLNLADCMSYAFAKSRNFRLLYVGKDFSHTDIKAA